MAGKKFIFTPGKLYVPRNNEAREVYPYPLNNPYRSFHVPENVVFMFLKSWEEDTQIWAVFLAGEQTVLAQYGLLEELK